MTQCRVSGEPNGVARSSKLRMGQQLAQARGMTTMKKRRIPGAVGVQGILCGLDIAIGAAITDQLALI